jgi:hypothetical protein
MHASQNVANVHLIQLYWQIIILFATTIVEFKYILKRSSYTSFNKLISKMFKRFAYVCVMYVWEWVPDFNI